MNIVIVGAGSTAGGLKISKLVLSLTMLIGRLDVMPMMVLAASIFSKKR